MADRNTAIRRSQLKPIQYDDLDATNVAVDNYIPSFDEATGKFTWVANTGAGVPGGSDTQVQFNDAGVFGGDTTFLWDKTNDRLTVNGKILTQGIWDADMDTGVQVSEGWVDEDIIRFDTAGFERWQIDASGNFIPSADNSYDIGTSVLGIKDLYLVGTIYGDTSSPVNFGADGLTINAGQIINEFSIDGTLAGNSDTALPTEKAVKTYVDGLTGIDDFTIKRTNNNLKIADRIEQNIMLNAFRIAVNGSLTQFNMVDGITDEFEDESGVDTVNSTNEAYDSVNDLYSPSSQGLDSYTKLMLHCNGVDGSTTFIDDSASAHTVTANGDAQIDTAQSKFGGAGGLFDGAGDYLTIPDSDDFTFGSVDFTIDLWVRFNAGNDWSTIDTFVGQGAVGDSPSTYWQVDKDSTTNKLRMYFVNAGVVKASIAMTNDWSVSTETWYHIAFVRSGSSAYIFIDGFSQTITETTAFGSNDVGNAANTLSIGRKGNNTNFLYGHLEEVRVSKGIARWTADFTPETSEYGTTLDNMTLIANSTTAEAQPDNARIILFEEDVDTITINTDLKVYISIDGGSTWAQASLQDEGNYEADKRILSGIVDVSGQTGTSVVWKIETLNNKDLKMRGIGLLWD